MIRAVVGANHCHRGTGARHFQQISQRHSKGLRDAHRDRKGGVGLLAFDLAKHGTADSARISQGVQRPAFGGPQVLYTASQMSIDGIRQVWPRRQFVGFGLSCAFHILEIRLAYRKRLSSLPEAVPGYWMAALGLTMRLLRCSRIAGT